MKTQFDILRKTRANLSKILSAFNEEQLLKVPTGYKNNLAWNIGHNIVTQNLLCYKLSGLEIPLEAQMVKDYMKGSEAISSIDFDLEALLISTVDRLEEDYNNGVFKEFNEYPTSYGFALTSIEDAISFNNVHEGLHLGYCMALKKNI